MGDENKIEKSVSVSVSQINVTGVQYYNGEIYILWVEDGFVSQVRHMFGSGGDSRYVSVYDGINYKEERKWQVPSYKRMSNMVVINKKVYVSDPHNKRLCVYSPAGEAITKVSHKIFRQPDHLAICASDSIIISDPGANRVSKLYIIENTITWTCTEVESPRGVCCHISGGVFVWSQSTKSLFLLSSATGELPNAAIYV